MKIIEICLERSWKGETGPHLNHLVGYYVDSEDGLLKYDILRRHRDASQLAPGARQPSDVKRTKQDVLLECREAARSLGPRWSKDLQKYSIYSSHT